LSSFSFQLVVSGYWMNTFKKPALYVHHSKEYTFSLKFVPAQVLGNNYWSTSQVRLKIASYRTLEDVSGNSCTSLYVCMAIKYIIVLFVETPRKFITARLSIRKPRSSSVLIICDLFNSHALFIYKSVVICWLASFENLINIFHIFAGKPQNGITKILALNRIHLTPSHILSFFDGYHDMHY
jgi:hypothetical protein